MIPLDEVARISSSEPSLDQQQDLNIFKKNTNEVDEDFHMPLTPGSSDILRIETIPDGFNSARAYHLKVILRLRRHEKCVDRVSTSTISSNDPCRPKIAQSVVRYRIELILWRSKQGIERLLRHGSSSFSRGFSLSSPLRRARSSLRC